MMELLKELVHHAYFSTQNYFSCPIIGISDATVEQQQAALCARLFALRH